MHTVNNVVRATLMPRQPDIHAAFLASIQQNPKGYLCLKTCKFIDELRVRNWHFSQADANAWIKRYQPDFADKTKDGSDNRYWILRNMGGGFSDGLSFTGYGLSGTAVNHRSVMRN